MRYVIHGAGAIGGVIAARLMAAGAEVALIARGEAREALAARGLELRGAHGVWRSAVTVAADPSELGLKAGDVVVLAMKSQDTAEAIRALAAAAPEGRAESVTILCAQNGVGNERTAARRFPRVLGAYVYVWATAPEPGVARCFTGPSFGVIDVGLHPDGIDADVIRIRSDLEAAGFDSEARADIMAWKHAKLIDNLANAPDAAFGPRAVGFAPLEEARREALACFAAAGIVSAPTRAGAARIAHLQPLRRVDGEAFPGGSTWQSLQRGLARGAAKTEIDYLTGEIVRLGRRHGVATPVNAALLRLVKAMAAGGEAPGSRDPAGFASALQAQDDEGDHEEAV